MANLPHDNAGEVIPTLRFGSTEVVATSATSAQNTVDTGKHRVLRIVSNIDFYILEGDNPTATSSHALVPAGFVEYVFLPKDKKFAVIRAGASDGSVWMTEMV